MMPTIWASLRSRCQRPSRACGRRWACICCSPPSSRAVDSNDHTSSVSWKHMSELVFEVVQEADGGYCAECLTENIFTQGDTWDELRENSIEATAAFFFDRPKPT